MQTVTFQLAVADLVDARSYVHSRLLLVRIIRLALFVFTFGCVVRIAYMALQQDWSGLMPLTGWLFGGLALIVWGYVANPWLVPSSARKQLARNKGLQGDQVVSWDAENFALEGSHGQSRWAWADLYRWQESRGGFLLWQGDRVYFYLPKRSLMDNQTTEVRGLLVSAVGRPGKRRR